MLHKLVLVLTAMETWLKLSLFLCVFGFLKELRPSEMFYFDYLTGKWWNCTAERVQQDLMPISTYTQMASSFVMLLITDLFLYKPIIILLALSGVGLWIILSWGSTLLQLQCSLVFYGIFYAAEVAYFTYIYAKVPKEHYVQVTSHTRAALILGHGLAGVISQTLVQFELLDYQQLNYISFSSMVASLIWAFLLPPVKTSVYFHSQSESKTISEKCTSAFKLMKHHFIASYSQWHVIKWSIWWSLSMCGFVHVQLYSQPLWSSIVSDTNSQLYNGVAESAMTAAGFLSTIAVGLLNVDWRKYGDLTRILCSLLSAIFIIVSSQTENVLISYACYTAFGGVYYFVIAIAASEVAKCILPDSYGLVFGFNSSLALIMQCLVLLVFVTGSLGWALSPRGQHFAYGLCHIGIAILFTVMAMVKSVKRYVNRNKVGVV